MHQCVQMEIKASVNALNANVNTCANKYEELIGNLNFHVHLMFNFAELSIIEKFQPTELLR